MTTYRRAPGVLWRAAADRVLVRRVGERGPAAEADLAGPAAVVWLALERPCSLEELRAALARAGDAHDAAERSAAMLVQHHLVVAEADH